LCASGGCAAYWVLRVSFEDELAHWLEIHAARSILPDDLLQQTESLLRSWQAVLFTFYTLERLMASAAAQAQQAILVRKPNAYREDYVRAGLWC
jgi:hypothetical protein